MIRKADILSGVLSLICLLLSEGCTKETILCCTEEDLKECKVAVVLPLSGGQEAKWKQCLEICSNNLSKAFCRTGMGVKLVYEWYEEQSPDLRKIAGEIASRSDIKAVIGGQYSDDALVLADVLSDADKPLFTIATTDQLIRGYSKWGNLWAMTETDITQCEVLLSKAIQYGAKSVALIVDGDSAYGDTFVDWFPFQALELGVRNAGVFSCLGDTEDQTRAALATDADYIICALSHTESLKGVLTAYNSTPHTAKLLMSDTAYMSDVIASLGDLVEGVEGVSFGPDPSSGFEVIYSTIVGRPIMFGESQVYDAAMLIGYASMLQMFHKHMGFKEAMRQIVSGRDDVDSFWGEDGMLRVTRSLASGGHPDIDGASGRLEFDEKVYTNVLGTVYMNYVIYEQKYLTLGYCSTKGDRRAGPTLAEWNWNKSKMQDIEGGGDVKYPALDKRWALLIATSTGWENYRHQADVLNIYQQLKSAGYDDDHILLIMEDDLARNPANPQKGVLYSRMDGVNIYKDVKVDYHISDLQPVDFKDILLGRKSAHLPQVLESDADDNVFVFWSGHGGPGFLEFGDSYITRGSIDDCLDEMEKVGNYRQSIWFIEACYSGSVAKAADNHNHIIAITAAGEDESSKGDEYNPKWEVWMSNRFSATLQDCMKTDPDMALSDLYYRLFQSTVGSHVHVYGIQGY
ncbi:MAG: ABC transporter substrate-binding protein, partial [Bacteroidales bacterium]|nr:ABC transporter substrate-binding protein [Bacteroidales bacterium]